jgi:hypothetical protein
MTMNVGWRASQTCRFADFMGNMAVDNGTGQLVDLPADEQVSRGKALLSMLQEPGQLLDSEPDHPLGSQRYPGEHVSIDETSDGVNVVIKHGFIHCVDPAIAVRTRAKSVSDMEMFSSSASACMHPSPRVTQSDVCQDFSDASTEDFDACSRDASSRDDTTLSDDDVPADPYANPPQCVPYQYPQASDQPQTSQFALVMMPVAYDGYNATPMMPAQSAAPLIPAQNANSMMPAQNANPVMPAHTTHQMMPAQMGGFDNATPMMPVQMAGIDSANTMMSARIGGMDNSNPMMSARMGGVSENYMPMQWAPCRTGSLECQPANTEQLRLDSLIQPVSNSREWRTTVMLRNLPLNYTREMLLSLIDSMGFAGTYDFAYLPIDFTTQAGLGYAFINFHSGDTATLCFDYLEGFSDWKVRSEKVCTITWSSPYQGLDAHIERYRNSPVMHHSIPDNWKPVLLQQGMRIKFPHPTKDIPTPKTRQAPSTLTVVS